MWYLSRKGADPLIAEKASQLVEEAQEQISFLRTKNFFLRILEKTAYRFKVGSLKMHNKLNDLTQTLKVHRRRFQDGVLAKKSLEQANDLEQKQALDQSLLTETVLEKPIFRRPKFVETQGADQSIPIHSMVNETAIQPEIVRERVGGEEDLIARIAIDPRDFIAYEALGDYYLEIGNVKDAKECYRQVLKLSPVQQAVKIKIRRLEKILGGNAE